MKEKNKQRNEVYRTVEEFEKEFIPNFHEKKLAEERSKEPSIFGTGLATELLECIRDELMK